MVLIPKQRYEAEIQQRKEEHGNEESSVKNVPTPCVATDELGNMRYLIDIAIPLKYKHKMVSLLLYLKNHTSIKWNERGEVSINDHIIDNSHIVDLVRDLFLPNAEGNPPEGAQQFQHFLSSIHLPRSLISNGKRKQSTAREETEEEGEEKTTKDQQVLRESCYPEADTPERRKNLYVKKNINKIFTSNPKKKKWIRIDSFF